MLLLRKSFLIKIFILIILFSCDFNFQTPKEIIVKKETPELRFDIDADGVELMGMFGDLNFDFGETDEVASIDCVNMEIITKLLYIELYEGDVSDDIDKDSLIDDGGDYYYTKDDKFDVVFSSRPIQIKAPDFTGSELEGFKLKPSRTRLYLSGNNQEFVDMLGVELFTVDEFGFRTPINNEPFGKSPPSGVAMTDAEFSGLELPLSENEFLFSIDEDADVEFNVFIRPNQQIPKEWLNEEIIILVELAIWFPFEFVAGSDVNNLKLPLDDLFPQDDDLFGRKNADDDSFIEYIEEIFLEIELSKMPFPNSTVLMKVADVYIMSDLIENIIRISMGTSNLLYPFIPSFYVRFSEGEEVFIPRELELKKFSFKARLKFSIEISDTPPNGWEEEW